MCHSVCGWTEKDGVEYGTSGFTSKYCAPNRLGVGNKYSTGVTVGHYWPHVGCIVKDKRSVLPLGVPHGLMA